MAERLECWTGNSEASSSSPALTAVQIFDHICKWQVGLPPASWDS